MSDTSSKPIRAVLAGSALLLLGACQGTESAASVDARPDRALDWSLGTWRGVRRDGRDGSTASMIMRVEPVLDGGGQVRHIEIRHDHGVYRGFAVQVYDPDRARWVRRYVNAVRWRFAELEGDVSSDRGIWRSTSPGRTRDSRLVSERPGPDRWRRTMHVSADGGKTWQVLWIDELRRG